MEQHTNQNNNIAHGNIAGRDVTVYNTNEKTSLGYLIEKYQKEIESDCTLKEYIEDLDIFAKAIPFESVQGLQNKLIAAERSDEIYEAMRFKENVYKQLITNFGSRTFQQIYAYLLGLVKERYIAYVKPFINNNSTKAEIDRHILEDVINPVLSELNTCGAVHEFNIQKIKGLLYFLGGNCHIRWD